MALELATKFLDIDPAATREKLKTIANAKLVYPERLMKRKVFDFPDRRLEKSNAWVRVRDEGDGKTTLTYKQLIDNSLYGTKEIEMDVKGFDDAFGILIAIGLEPKADQESKREKWTMGDVEVIINTWPWVPPFLEIDGPSEESLKAAVAALGLNWAQAVHGSVEVVYQKEYDVLKPEIYAIPSITFVDVPDWLQKRKRK